VKFTHERLPMRVKWPLYDHRCPVDFRNVENFGGQPEPLPKTETIKLKVEVDASELQELLTEVRGVTIHNLHGPVTDLERTLREQVLGETFCIEKLVRKPDGTVMLEREQLANFPTWTPKWYFEGRATRGPRQERDRRRIVSSLMDEVGVVFDSHGGLSEPLRVVKTKNTNDNVGLSAPQALFRKLAQYLGPRK
jgi:hypothetical protein